MLPFLPSARHSMQLSAVASLQVQRERLQQEALLPLPAQRVLRARLARSRAWVLVSSPSSSASSGGCKTLYTLGECKMETNLVDKRHAIKR